MKLCLLLEVLASAAVAAAASQFVSPRPCIIPSPKSPRLPIPSPPQRNRYCVVQTHGDGVTDDSPHIMSAFHECNNGGHVIFSRGLNYTIGTAMDWTFLQHIDIGSNPRLSREPGARRSRLLLNPFVSLTLGRLFIAAINSSVGGNQIFKVASSSPTTPPTGRPTRLSSAFKTSPPSSSSVARTSSSSEVSLHRPAQGLFLPLCGRKPRAVSSSVAVYHRLVCCHFWPVIHHNMPFAPSGSLSGLSSI
jgi:hypothetical protein